MIIAMQLYIPGRAENSTADAQRGGITSALPPATSNNRTVYNNDQQLILTKLKQQYW